jgi:hypothetical protein
MNEEELKINEYEETDDYAEALESTPIEVRSFMWSDTFSVILNTISDVYRLNDNQRDVLKSVVMETLVGTITPISRQIKLSDVGITGELQDKVLQSISQEILSRAIVEIDNGLATEEDSFFNTENIGSATAEVQAPSPLQALNSIQERLTKPTTVAPITTRDYSINKSEQSTTTHTEMSPKPKIMDIYRELPEQ